MNEIDYLRKKDTLVAKWIPSPAGGRNVCNIQKGKKGKKPPTKKRTTQKKNEKKKSDHHLQPDREAGRGALNSQPPSKKGPGSRYQNKIGRVKGNMDVTSFTKSKREREKEEKETAPPLNVFKKAFMRRKKESGKNNLISTYWERGKKKRKERRN